MESFLQTADITVLLDKIGVNPLVIKSGDLKAVPNPVERTDSLQYEYIKNIVLLDARRVWQNCQFRRKYPLEIKKKLLMGEFLQAIRLRKINLIDEVGVESDALDWLKKAGLDDKI